MAVNRESLVATRYRYRETAAKLAQRVEDNKEFLDQIDKLDAAMTYASCPHLVGNKIVVVVCWWNEVDDD